MQTLHLLVGVNQDLEPLNRSNWSFPATRNHAQSAQSAHVPKRNVLLRAQFPVRQDDPSISAISSCGPSSRACFWAPGVSGPTRVTSTTASPSFTLTRSMGWWFTWPRVMVSMVSSWDGLLLGQRDGISHDFTIKKKRLLVESSDI